MRKWFKSDSSCPFCDIGSKSGFHIVHEDALFVIFRDHKPAAKVHVLCCPKKHISNVKTLTSEHLPLVRSMAELGSRVLITLGVPHDHQRMGFHIPPFNSIDHLHLHLLGGPFTRFGSIRYLDLGRPGPMGSIKGISWFATPETVCEILSLPNGRVTVGVVRSKPVSLNKKEKARQVEDWTGFASQPLSPTVTIQRRVSGSSNT